LYFIDIFFFSLISPLSPDFRFRYVLSHWLSLIRQDSFHITPHYFSFRLMPSPAGYFRFLRDAFRRRRASLPPFSPKALRLFADFRRCY